MVEADLSQRPAAPVAVRNTGFGRELFSALRTQAQHAEGGGGINPVRN